MTNERETITIEDAQLIYKNFSGTESAFNVAGNREFSVILDEETARNLLDREYNVKFLKPREEDDDDLAPVPYLPVSVSYKVRPPTIVMITSTGRAKLDDTSVETLDWADIVKADLIISPYRWTIGTGANTKTGVKAYLRSLYVTVQEDELERKYALQAMEDDNA